MTLSEPVKLGLRAAIAVIVSLLIVSWFHLPRGYWAVLTSILLMSSSWGEAVFKAWYRVVMTILGCGFGTLLVWWFGHGGDWRIVILVIAVGYLVFYLLVSYGRAMFAVGVIVVMLFDILRWWDLHLLNERIYETAIGAAVTVAVARWCWPHYAADELIDQYQSTMTMMQQYLQKLWQCKDQRVITIGHELAGAMTSLRVIADKVRYERFGLPRRYDNAYEAARQFDVMYHYLNHMGDAWQMLQQSNIVAECQGLLDAYQNHIAQSLRSLAALSAHQLWSADKREQFSERMAALRRTCHYDAGAFMALVAVFHYLQRLDETMNDITIIEQE